MSGVLKTTIPMSTMTAGDHHSWLWRFAFGFFAVYLVLFILPFPLDELGFPTFSGQIWQAIVSWVALHVLQIDPVTLAIDITGDTVGAWVRVFCCLVLAFVGALVWAWFDRQRRHDLTVHEWVRVYVRYALAYAMLYYAQAKLVGMQFPFPESDQLGLTFGESEPFVLLWNFMGYSIAYTLFTGVVEVAAGLLLLFRRTTTLGALVTAGVMTNVVMLNLSYDVPVKLKSIHLLFFALFLLAPDLRRLAGVLVFNRPTEAVSLARLWPARWMAHVAVGAKVLIVGWFLYSIATEGVSNAAQYGYLAPKPELYGNYDVETFTRDGQVVPPLLTDTTRWRTIGFNQRGGTVGLQVRHMNNALFFGYGDMEIDTARGTMTLDSRLMVSNSRLIPSPQPDGPASPPVVVAFTRPGPDQVLLEGTFDGAELTVLLHRVDENNLPLVKRKFRWTRRR